MISKKKWSLLQNSHRHEKTAFVSARINSPCYHLITRLVIDKDITPTEVSISTIFLAIGGALAYIHGYFPLGGILVQLVNIVDGVDGEIARIKNLGSKFGEVVDSLSDRMVEILLCLAIGYSVWHIRGSVWGWVFGLIGLVGLLGGNYLTELVGARAGREVLEKSWRDLESLVRFRLNHRSNQLFVIFVFSLLGRPELALLLIGIIAFFYSGLRLCKMLPYLKKAPSHSE